MAIIGDLNTIYRDEDIVLTFDIDEDVLGWDIRFILVDPLTLAEVYTSSTATIVDAVNGIVTVALAGSVTLALPPRVYWYEVRRTNAGNKAVLRTGNVPIEDSPSTIGDVPTP